MATAKAINGHVIDFQVSTYRIQIWVNMSPSSALALCCAVFIFALGILILYAGSPCYLVLFVWVTEVNLDSRSGRKNLFSVCNIVALFITELCYVCIVCIGYVLPCVIRAIRRSFIHAQLSWSRPRRILEIYLSVKRRSGEFCAGFSQSHNHYPSSIQSTRYSDILSLFLWRRNLVK